MTKRENPWRNAPENDLKADYCGIAVPERLAVQCWFCARVLPLD